MITNTGKERRGDEAHFTGFKVLQHEGKNSGEVVVGERNLAPISIHVNHLALPSDTELPSKDRRPAVICGGKTSCSYKPEHCLCP